MMSNDISRRDRIAQDLFNIYINKSPDIESSSLSSETRNLQESFLLMADYVVEKAGDINKATLEEEGCDMVNKAPHYNSGGIECIEAIRSCLTEEEFIGACKFNAMKYIWREKHKGGTESLNKAQYYLDKIISVRDSST